MCVVSMIGDHYGDKWGKRWPEIAPGYVPRAPIWPLPADRTVEAHPVSREEFDQLKKDVAEMVALLKRAKKYDKDKGEPDCEIADKMAFLRKIAKLVGVDLDKELTK